MQPELRTKEVGGQRACPTHPDFISTTARQAHHGTGMVLYAMIRLLGQNSLWEEHVHVDMFPSRVRRDFHKNVTTLTDCIN